MILFETTALCKRCHTFHAASLRREHDVIEGVVACPHGEMRYQISTDAEMFLEIRRRSATDLTRPTSPDDLRFVLNYMSITNACNLECKICAAEAVKQTGDASFLPLQEIVTRAREVRRHGGKILHLFGGEPTLHPELLAIVSQLKQMGFSTGIVTNGIRIGRDPGLAGALKRNGLSRICLQFDSLRQETLKRLGRDHLKEKLAAIRNALAAGLNLGLNCTVTSDNAEELHELLTHGLDLGSGVKNMTFGSAVPVGRYELDQKSSPDREAIIKKLLEHGEMHRFSFDDVMPLPAYLPWGLQVHPECGAHIVFIRTPGGIEALNRIVDLHHLYRKMGASRLKGNGFTRFCLPAFYTLTAVKKGRLLRALRCAWGVIFNRPGYGIVNVGIINYRGSMFLDKERIDRCAAAFYTSVGPVRACLHFLGNQDVPGSREKENRDLKCSLAG